MRTVKIWSRATGSSLPTYEVAPLNCTAGSTKNKSAICYHIAEVPDDVSDERVARMMDLTSDLTFLKNPRFTFRFSEIGEGKIIR